MPFPLTMAVRVNQLSHGSDQAAADYMHDLPNLPWIIVAQVPAVALGGKTKADPYPSKAARFPEAKALLDSGGSFILD